MRELWFKKYWDIIAGILTGVILSIISQYEINKIQLFYSIIILMLVSIGCFRTIRQAMEKKNKERHTPIDALIDGQKPIKAINIAQSPTKEGEKIGNILIKLFRGIETIMKKFTEWFSKFKGYMLTIALAILTIIEMCGGFINSMFGGVLTINGVEILPIVTLVCTAVVGIISNGYSKEQIEKIRALFSKSSTNELVVKEIKKAITENTAQLAQLNKVLTNQERELENLESELETLTNTLSAKKTMYGMTPRLASEEDVKIAADAVTECTGKIVAKKTEIETTKGNIEKLTTMIEALKSQV